MSSNINVRNLFTNLLELTEERYFVLLKIIIVIITQSSINDVLNLIYVSMVQLNWHLKNREIPTVIIALSRMY